MSKIESVRKTKKTPYRPHALDTTKKKKQAAPARVVPPLPKPTTQERPLQKNPKEGKNKANAHPCPYLRRNKLVDRKKWKIQKKKRFAPSRKSKVWGGREGAKKT